MTTTPSPPTPDPDWYWVRHVRPGIGWQGCGTATGMRVRYKAVTLAGKWLPASPARGLPPRFAPGPLPFVPDLRPGDLLLFTSPSGQTVRTLRMPTNDIIKSTLLREVLVTDRWYSALAIARLLRDHLEGVSSHELTRALTELDQEGRVLRRLMPIPDGGYSAEFSKADT